MSRLLHQLLVSFDLDQGAFIELQDNGEVDVLFSMDRTKKILPEAEGLWLSKSIIEKTIMEFHPIHYMEGQSDETEKVPQSIHKHNLKNILCLPLSKGPTRVVYMAAKRDPFKTFNQDEINAAKISAKFASLALEQKYDFEKLKENTESLEKKLSIKPVNFIYQSQQMQEVFEQICKMARYNITLLLQGESGTGKEELAKEIHRISGRPGPLVTINCANLSESLLESELFGHKKGSFTGAHSDKKGMFLEADKGTLFLDEIAEIPIDLQAKLLRAIQEKAIKPVGSTQLINVDIRIIAASHQDLFECVGNGTFREDLYYRIQEMPLKVPPLRERTGDVELLAKHFINQFCREFNVSDKSLSFEATKLINEYQWPGNIRELKNICRTAVILSPGETINSSDLRLPSAKPKRVEHPNNVTELNQPEQFKSTEMIGKTLKDLRKEYDRMIIQQFFDAGFSQEEIASKLDVSVRTLQRINHREEESSYYN